MISTASTILTRMEETFVLINASLFGSLQASRTSVFVDLKDARRRRRRQVTCMCQQNVFAFVPAQIIMDFYHVYINNERYEMKQKWENEELTFGF